LPEPFEEVQECEENQRVLVREALAPLEAGSKNGHNKSGIPEFAVDAVADATLHEIQKYAHRLRGVDYRTREHVRRELRRQIAPRLLREEI
jgi:hypothetical protein